jgi:hypothetical protein
MLLVSLVCLLSQKLLDIYIILLESLLKSDAIMGAEILALGTEMVVI